MSKLPLRIGIETRLMAGHMTGVGNYAFHLLSALTGSCPELEYFGFGRASWSTVDGSTLRQIARHQHKGIDTQEVRTGAIVRVSNALRQRASRIDVVRKIYRRAHSLAFAGTVSRQRLDLFHALNFIPPSDPGIPVLPVVYDLSFLRYPAAHPAERLRWLEPLEKIVQRSPVVQTISEFSGAEIAEAYGIPRNRIVVAAPAASSIYRFLGKDASTAHLRALELDYGSYLLAVGTLEPRKNLRTLITAYSLLTPAERRRAPLAIAGGLGWGNIDLPQAATALKSEGTLRFVGPVPDPVLRSLYEGAIALLFPSVYEGFGMPAVEAMSCGTPVVHSVNTSVDEVTNGLCPRLDALDVDAWASEVKALIASGYEADPARRRALIARAGAYDWVESARKVRSAYDSLLA
jgi:glycosyltransferase involved in cell wall biosynthesis